MGKPLGLGIIKIKPKLYILDLMKRYMIFSDNNYIDKTENMDNFIKSF